MNPITDTLTAALERWPIVFSLWALFAILPFVVPFIIALARRPSLVNPARFSISAASRIVGYPTYLILLFVVPWAAFEILLVPVIFDAYPSSKSALSIPLNATHWLLWNMYWLVPLVWLGWVFAASVYFARRWHALHTNV